MKERNDLGGKKEGTKMKTGNEFWEKRNVLITGADGFIGGWIAKELVERKANVTALVRDLKTDGTLKLHGIKEKINLVQGDLLEYNKIERALNEFEINTCFHLAAQAIVPIANRAPISTFESNIQGTWNLLEACRRTKAIERIVIASSDKAYGTQKELPYREEFPLLGAFPYDASKACSEIIARAYFQTYSLPLAITRNANTYGGADLNFSRIVPDAIRSVIQNKEFQIRSDGKPERDYMYVKDAVSAYLALAENLHRKEVRGEAFNFGTEKPISVIELFKLIAKLCGKPNAKAKILGTAKNEIDKQYLCTEKARKILEWKPQYSLEEGMKETIEWYKNYFKTK